MDKKQELELSEKQLDQVIEVSQLLRDFSAKILEERSLTINQCLCVLAAIVASFLCEFDEQCPATHRQEMREHLDKVIDFALESYDNNENNYEDK